MSDRVFTLEAVDHTTSAQSDKVEIKSFNTGDTANYHSAHPVLEKAKLPK